MGGGCIWARVGPDCSPGAAAAPHFTPCVQKYLFPFSGGQETLSGLLSERPLVVSMWEEAGLEYLLVKTVVKKWLSALAFSMFSVSSLLH